MPATDSMNAWVKGFLGVDPAKAAPVSGAAGPEGPTQPMMADCKPVHGKVPGPQNHLLCATHGHVVDVTAKTIIARDVKDYVARHLGGKGPGGAVHPAGPQHAGTQDKGPQAIGAKPLGAPPAGAPPLGAPPVGAPPVGAPSVGAPPIAAQSAGGQDVAKQGAGKGSTLDAVAMQVISNQIVEHLHNQYHDLAEGVQETMDRWTDTIDKLKDAAPKEPGGLLGSLFAVMKTVASVAFPEIALVEVTLKVVELGEHSKEQTDAKREAEEAKRLSQAKMQAKEALKVFAHEVRKEAQNARGKLVGRVKAAVKDFTPDPDFDQKILDDMDRYAGDFAKNHLKINIGTDADPNAITSAQQKLSTAIAQWLKNEYVEEHETEKVQRENPMLGYGKFDGKTMKQRVEEYLKDNPDKKAEIDKALKEDYTDEFLEKVLGEKQ